MKTVLFVTSQTVL